VNVNVNVNVNMNLNVNMNMDVNVMRGQRSAVPIASCSRIEEWLREKAPRETYECILR